MNWIDFAKKYNIENPLEFFADLESVSRKADKPILKQTHVIWGHSPEPLPCCSKCGMPGQVLGTRCLAEDCPGVQPGNGI